MWQKIFQAIRLYDLGENPEAVITLANQYPHSVAGKLGDSETINYFIWSEHDLTPELFTEITTKLKNLERHQKQAKLFIE
jgi:hypothetical protein